MEGTVGGVWGCDFMEARLQCSLGESGTGTQHGAGSESVTSKEKGRAWPGL